MYELYPYQEIGKEFLAQRRTALLGDDMGIGKTIQAIRAIHAVVKRMTSAGAATPPMPLVASFNVLIVAPAHLLMQWSDQIRSQLPSLPANLKISAVSYNIATNFADDILKDFDHHIDFLIFDEAHYMKCKDSKRTQKLLGADSIVHYAKRVWLLTGTPVTNKPIELWHILKVLAPWCLGAFRRYDDFVNHFCLDVTTFKGRIVEAKGSKNEEELNRMLGSWMLRRTKAEVLPFLPPVNEEVIPIPFDQGEFHQILFESEILKMDLEDPSVPHIGSLSTLRRLVGLSKRQSVTQHIKNVLASGKTVCAYGWHPELLEHIKLNIPDSAMIIGGTGETKREAEKTKFREGKVKLFLGQTEAAGEGMDGFQEVCDFLVFVEPDWLPKTRDQVIGRLHRLGQKGSSVTVQYLVAADTVEENILRSQTKKSKSINKIVNKGE